MLAEQVRSGLVETLHDGAIAIVDATGELLAWAGDIERPFFFRSAAKPFQATISQAAGAGLVPEELALACASHDGEAVHLAMVEAMLNRSGLSEADLRCPPDWPIRAEAERRLLLAGEVGPRRLFHNCSGKHTAMLRACVGSGWDPATYLDADSPLQEQVTELISEVSRIKVRIGVDGCGAPVHSTTVVGMARAFQRLAVDDGFSHVYRAMHSYPRLVSGINNADSAIAISADAVAKRGARGALGVSVRHRFGMAVKCWDGSDQVAGMTAIAALDQLEVFPANAWEPLQRHRQPRVKGGGVPVGAYRSLLELRWV
jgi:L-asparaginase II